MADTQLRVTPKLLVELMRRGINAGIPPTALSNMLNVDVEVLKNLTLTIRREKYGTAELSEVLTDLTWRAIDKQYELIQNGSPELSLKATQAILGKALATSVRQTPEEVSRAREEILAVAGQDRILDIEGEEIEPEASAFVAVDEQADD